MVEKSENAQRLDGAVAVLATLNLDVALKVNLGEVSLAPALRSRINDLTLRCNAAREYVDQVNRLFVVPLAEAIQAFSRIIGTMTGTAPADFIQQRENFRSNIANALDNIEVALAPFEQAEMKHRLNALLGESSDDIEKVRAELKKEADEILKGVKSEAESVLNEARQQASAIQSTARKTATGVSVLQTGVRFAELIDTFRRGLWISGTCATLAFIAFVSFVIWLGYFHPDLRNIPDAIYTSAIRVTLLASIAAVVTFSLKIFRSNLHMYYHTLHREQLTNSIESFVDAARTDEHRDAVLTKLIESVSTFSASGLVGSGDDMPNTAKVIVDTLPKAFGKSDP